MHRLFKKKPVVVEAVQFIDSKEGIADVLRFYGHAALIPSGMVNKILIKTLEGTMIANPSDWIIKGVKGEFYPCKPDIFEQTYEEVTNLKE